MHSKRVIAKEAVLFVMVGATLFGVDLCILLLLQAMSWYAPVSNFVSVSIATGVAFIAHLKITFGDRQLANRTRVFLRYLWAVVFLAIFNFIISSLAILAIGDATTELIAIKISTVGLVSIIRFVVLRKIVYV